MANANNLLQRLGDLITMGIALVSVTSIAHWRSYWSRQNTSVIDEEGGAAAIRAKYEVRMRQLGDDRTFLRHCYTGSEKMDEADQVRVAKLQAINGATRQASRAHS